MPKTHKKKDGWQKVKKAPNARRHRGRLYHLKIDRVSKGSANAVVRMLHKKGRYAHKLKIRDEPKHEWAVYEGYLPQK